MHRPLFSGSDLILDVRHGDNPTSIVTFEARDKSLTAMTPGRFGAGFGKGIFPGMNEFIIRRSRNHWYQTSEILEVIGIINRIARGTQVITYGSSMGAFAAINFAPMLNASKFIALSPVFDIETGNAPGDMRWPQEGRMLDWRYNFIKTGQCRSASGYVFYSGAQDEKHAALIKRQTQATAIPVEYGGHPCTFYINDTYKLKAVVAEIADGSFSTDRFHAVVRDRTHLTSYPYERAASEAERRGDLTGAISQMRIALEKKELSHLRHRLGDLLLKAGDLDAAEAEFRKAIVAEPRIPTHYIRMSYVKAARKDYSEAVSLMRKAIAINDSKPEFHVRLGEWLIRAADYAGAEKAMEAALALEPKFPIATKRLKAIRRRMRLAQIKSRLWAAWLRCRW